MESGRAWTAFGPGRETCHTGNNKGPLRTENLQGGDNVNLIRQLQLHGSIAMLKDLHYSAFSPHRS